jgi:hypothetical protein
LNGGRSVRASLAPADSLAIQDTRTLAHFGEPGQTKANCNSNINALYLKRSGTCARRVAQSGYAKRFERYFHQIIHSWDKFFWAPGPGIRRTVDLCRGGVIIAESQQNGAINRTISGAGVANYFNVLRNVSIRKFKLCDHKVIPFEQHAYDYLMIFEGLRILFRFIGFEALPSDK